MAMHSSMPIGIPRIFPNFSALAASSLSTDPMHHVLCPTPPIFAICIFSRGILSRRSLAKTEAPPYRTMPVPTSYLITFFSPLSLSASTLSPLSFPL